MFLILNSYFLFIYIIMNEIERLQNLLQKLNLLLTPDSEKVSTSKSQNLKDLEDFQDYPELKAFYIKSDGTTLNNLSAIRGDGFFQYGLY